MLELNLLTIFCLAGWAVYAAFDLASPRRRSISVVVLLYCFYYGGPLVLDLIAGPPDYIAFPGFREPSWSQPVAIAYDLFVMACPVFWWLTLDRKATGASQSMDLSPLNRIRWLLWALVLLPPALVLFAPDPSFYAHYGAVVTPALTKDIEKYQMWVTLSAFVSIVAAFGLLLSQRRITFTLCSILPFLAATVWVTGKRTDLVLPVCMIWLAFWVRGKVTPSVFIVGGLATGLGLYMFSSWYQQTLRPTAVLDSKRSYEMARVDFGRDHELRMALYCEITDDCRILDYRGESLVFYSTLFIPRAIWPAKPLPYATYLTAAGLMEKPRFFGWVVTCSVLDEAIANFGWFGLLIGPLFLATICRIGDYSDPLGKALAALVACLFMTFDPTPFLPVVLCWALYLAWSKWSLRSRQVAQAAMWAPARRAG